MRKVLVTVTAKIEIEIEEGIEISEVINEMNYGFTSDTDGARIIDESIEDFEIIDT